MPTDTLGMGVIVRGVYRIVNVCCVHGHVVVRCESQLDLYRLGENWCNGTDAENSESEELHRT